MEIYVFQLSFIGLKQINASILQFTGEMQETDVLFKSKKNMDATPPITKNETPQIPHEPFATKIDEEPTSESETAVTEEAVSSAEEAKPVESS